MIREMGEYLRIEQVTTRQMADLIDTSPMKVSTMSRNLGGWRALVDYDARTGKIKRVWEEKTKVIYDHAEHN